MEITVLAYQQDAHKKYLWVKDKALASYTTDDIEILIATMDREDLSFLERIFSLPVSQITQPILIVNQSKTRQLSSNIDSIRVINDANYGLSRSRNIALENATRKYVWILDDDVQILPTAMTHILQAIHKHPDTAALTFKMQLPNGKPKRSYAAEEFEYRKTHLSHGPASIEIVLNVKRMQTSGVRFNQRFGLGAQFPLGEEQVLFTDLLHAGEQGRFIPEFIVQHDEVSSGIDPTSKKTIYARGAVAAHSNQLKAIFLNFKYVFFLWRKGYVKNWSKLIEAYWLFDHGVEDYATGFEGHRNLHLDL
ncbi:glycosyltransferase [Nonlabens agnitus]|uniref:glycosyltransferase n=1 Tax=Nonlabens agnitus TaxID=870484 RepID=UPI0011B1F010|nr:glycosyltransferase family 2 protein [Nonlabens agnitus]